MRSVVCEPLAPRAWRFIISKLRSIIHELHPSNHQLTVELAVHGTSCILHLLNIATCLFSNPKSIKLTLPSSALGLSLSSVAGARTDH